MLRAFFSALAGKRHPRPRTRPPRAGRPRLEALEDRNLMSASPLPTGSFVLTPGQAAYSPNGRYELTLQTDGNLVEYGPGHQALWASVSTWGQPVSEAVMQSDGNFVIYGPDNADGTLNPLWASNTGGHNGATLAVQNDGNIVIYDTSGQALWADGGNAVSSTNGASTQQYNGVSAQVSDWINQAVSILQQNGYSLSVMDPQDIATIILHESSGDPNAVNQWDANYLAGHPSIGLMQVIQPTFDAYHLPGYDNIYDPVSNVIAGVRYAVATYGSVSNVPGLVALRNGQPYVGY